MQKMMKSIMVGHISVLLGHPVDGKKWKDKTPLLNNTLTQLRYDMVVNSNLNPLVSALTLAVSNRILDSQIITENKLGYAKEEDFKEPKEPTIYLSDDTKFNIEELLALPSWEDVVQTITSYALTLIEMHYMIHITGGYTKKEVPYVASYNEKDRFYRLIVEERMSVLKVSVEILSEQTETVGL